MQRLRQLQSLALALSFAAVSALAGNTEPVACLASDPAVWPAASKPYFLVIADTSTSMANAVAGSPSSCGFGSTRQAHARCALQRIFQTYDGVAQFGLATYAVQQSACSGACYAGCSYSVFPSEVATRGTNTGCGPFLGAGAATASGATIRVGVNPDDFWASPPTAPNSGSLLGWVDNVCSNNAELFATGVSPLNGSLRDASRYFAGGYVQQDGVTALSSPLNGLDYAGSGINGGTGCRSVNVILLTDSDETCDTHTDAVNAATDLYTNGVTVGSRNFKIRVHVINFAGATVANADQIAAAGGTSASQFVSNETQLLDALRTIVNSSLRAELADNADNNCSSCTDEGFRHYSNTNPTCCNWGTMGQRTTCLNNFSATISLANPTGTRSLLPCTTALQAVEPVTWLLHNPGDVCDGADNNGDGQVDEGQLKCGNPLACPSSDLCNGRDDDCDGQIDEGCPGTITLSAEICDGCDNDGNGLTDNGIAAIPCGLPSPANCVGTLTCKPSQVVMPGACAAGGGYNQCNNSPQAETCDGLDNNCNGVVDDGVAPTNCVPAGTPGGLIFGGTSQCRMGTLGCGQAVCLGFVGPSGEICDGVDNDCDGQVDEDFAGGGTSCGAIPGLVFDQPPSQCRSGLIQCSNGTQACAGTIGPSTEVLGDGIDNNCNGVTDEIGIFANGFE